MVRLRLRQMQTKLLPQSLPKLFKKVNCIVRSVLSTNLAKQMKKREKEPYLPRAIFESCLVPSAPKRPQKRAASLLKNRTPVGRYRCVGAQQK